MQFGNATTSNTTTYVPLATVSTPYAVPVLGIIFNVGTFAAVNGGLPTVASSTSTGTGVSGVVAFTSNTISGENFNLSTLYNGNWSIGALPANARTTGYPGVRRPSYVEKSAANRFRATRI